jgi:hypothetical protein
MSNSIGDWEYELDGTAGDSGGPAEAEDGSHRLFYASVADFVGEKLAPTYRRQINPGAGITWCPQWWRHAEAISRLEALWRSWEFLRLEGATGMSVWWRDHADYHMSVLLSADGPFKGCSPDDGHKPKLPPLPCEVPPVGLF